MSNPNPMLESIEDVIFSQGILFDLDIGRWAAHTKLHREDLYMASVNDEAFHLGHKKLLPKASVAKIQEYASKARTALMNRSSDFPIAGARFVRYPVLEPLLEELAGLKLKFLEEVKILLDAYPGLKAQQLAALNTQADKIADEKLANLKGATQMEIDMINGWRAKQYLKNEEAFPGTSEDLKFKFKFEWRMFKVSAADSLGQVSADQAIEMHKKLQGDLQQWVAETATLMHQTLGEAAAHAKELLEKQGKLNPKNLKPLFDAFESFKAIDFGGSDLGKQLDNIKEKYAFVKDGKIDYEKSAAGVNSSSMALETFQELLKSLGKYAVEDVAKEAGTVALSKITTYTRTMDVDD